MSEDAEEAQHSPPARTPEEWEQEADESAERFGHEVTALKEAMAAPPERRSYRLLWTNLRDLQEQVRTAPAIKADAKTTLQQRLRQVSERLRDEQKSARKAASTARLEFRAALNLIVESLTEVASVSDAHERRADLAVLRVRIENSGTTLDRTTRQQLWQDWQTANQAAWDVLTRLWQANEETLSGLLQEAQVRVSAGDLPGARERIKAFHAAISEKEASHRGARELRQTAGRLWQEADELAKKKHAAYLEHAARRLNQWRAAQSRTARTRSALEAEIAEAEERAATAPTDVGAALLRGRLAERRKALRDLEVEDRRLQSQIARAEAALLRP